MRLGHHINVIRFCSIFVCAGSTLRRQQYEGSEWRSSVGGRSIGRTTPTVVCRGCRHGISFSKMCFDCLNYFVLLYFIFSFFAPLLFCSFVFCGCSCLFLPFRLGSFSVSPFPFCFPLIWSWLFALARGSRLKSLSFMIFSLSLVALSAWDRAVALVFFFRKTSCGFKLLDRIV